MRLCSAQCVGSYVGLSNASGERQIWQENPRLRADARQRTSRKRGDLKPFMDLCGLIHALDIFEEVEPQRIATMFGQYLDLQEQKISGAQAEERMFAKLANPTFLADVRPLLSVEEAQALNDEAVEDGFDAVFRRIIAAPPGEPRVRTPEMVKHFDIDISA